MMRETRPLSPHVQIYRPQITSVLSIVHRVTGVGLSFGLVAFIWWLVAVAGDLDGYQTMVSCLTSPFGLVLFSGWAFAFCFHFANGLRHLGWDMGHGFEMPTVTKTGWMVVAFTAVTASVLIAFIWMGANNV